MGEERTKNGDDRLAEKEGQRPRARNLQRLNPALVLVDAEDVVRAAGLPGQALGALVQDDVATTGSRRAEDVSSRPPPSMAGSGREPHVSGKPIYRTTSEGASQQVRTHLCKVERPHEAEDEAEKTRRHLYPVNPLAIAERSQSATAERDSVTTSENRARD